MTWRLSMAIVFAAALAFRVLGAAAAEPRGDFFVSPDGRDGNPGTSARPFATIGRARDAVREKIAKGLTADVRVLIRGGTYRIAEPIVFGPTDSGTEEHFITYAAYPGQEVRISGGRVIDGWRADGDGSWRTTISEAKGGKWRFLDLYVGGDRRPRAAHPNGGYARVAKVIDRRRSFQFAAGAVPALKDIKQAELLLLHDWSVSRNPIESIDAKTRTLKTAHTIGGPMRFWNIDGFEKNPRFRVENAPELLDAPGEWYLDESAGTLTYRPTKGEKLGKVQFVAPVAKQLLAIRGDAAKKRFVRNLRFVGLTFEHAAWRPDGVRYAGGQACFHWAKPQIKGWGWQPATPAVSVEDAEDCRFEACTFTRLGGSGVWLGKGCRRGEIVGCVVSDVAGNGVMLGEAKAATGRVSGKHTVANCIIERCGALYYGAVGVWVGLSPDNQIHHNEIRHHPYTGVSIGWMWNPTPTPARANRVEHNHIHHVMQILSDGGGIYSLGFQPGSVLSGNHIHDVPLNAGRAESNGMFLDEGTTDIVIEGNLIYNIARSPLRFHKAGKNLVRDNGLGVKGSLPLVRYNATNSKNITLKDNTTLREADLAGESFKKTLAKIKRSAGLQPPWRGRLADRLR